MNVAVVGLGSMGKRRIRLLKKYSGNINIIGVDLEETRRSDAKQEYGIQVTDNLESLLENEKISAVFVCTAPLSHNTIITTALSHKVHVFTEINLVSDGYDRNLALAKENNVVLFLSSTFLYRDEIKYIEKQINGADEKVNYSYHIGQYLPDWHPWEHYNNFFVGNKKTNGCREIFAIELPWITEVFGEIENIQVIKGKTTSLDIDYNDTYFVILEHKNGNKGSLAVDVVSRKPVRNLEVYGENVYISWDGSPLGLYKYDLEQKKDNQIKLYDEVDHQEQYSSFVIENAYYNEIVSFFEVIDKKKEARHTFEKDKEILGWIDRIEKL